jgi:hypothetical protein
MQAKRPSLLLLMVALGLSVCAVPALAEDVGQFTRVVNEVDQLKQGKGPAKLAKVPGGVENQDLVQTKDKAMAVVQFVDDSTITISPKSKVTIEDYMYDANKGKSKGAIKILEGVVETVIPTTDKLQQKDIHIFTTTAIAGIRGTRLVTVVKPGGEGTIFYLIPDKGQAKPKKSKVKIRMFAPDVMPDAPAVQFVAERLKKKMPLTQIVDEALEAGLDPCAVVKAFILMGINPEKLVAAFQEICQSDPEYKTICTPCIILKCTIEAMRALKEVELSEMQYGILMKNLAPIIGNINPQDLNTITMLPTTGILESIPNFPPTSEQINEAKLPQDTLAVANALINAGADATLVSECLQGLGVPESPAMAVSAAPPPPPPPGVAAGGQPSELSGSR